MKPVSGRSFRCRLAVAACALSSCQPAAPDDGRIVLEYREKWNGSDGEAMRAVVDDFNASQNRLREELTTVSQLDRKLMLAISGGVPPDVAGLFDKNLPVLAEDNALTPLDALDGIRREDYVVACSRTGCFQSQQGGTSWHFLMAASTMIVLPVLTLFFLTQRTFIEGIATTGGK